MLKIRLQRVGRKHDPSFRMIVTEHTRSAKKGNGVEVLGSYDARTDRKQIDAERVKHWLSKGAQPSDTAHNILIDQGLIKGEKVKGVAKKVEAPKEEAPKAETPVVETSVAETPVEEVNAPEVSASEEAKAEAVAEEVIEEQKEVESPKEESAD